MQKTNLPTQEHAELRTPPSLANMSTARSLANGTVTNNVDTGARKRSTILSSAIERIVQLDRLEQQDFYSRLIEHMATLSRIQSPTELQAWLAECFPELFTYGILCLQGKVAADTLEVHNVLQHRYPERAFARHMDQGKLVMTQEMQQCLASGEPTFFRPPHDDAQPLASWNDHCKNNVDAVLVLSEFNKLTGAVVLISFSSLPPELPQEHLTALRLLSAHLHAAIARSDKLTGTKLCAATATLAVQLTKRETEVLHWMMQGKSNWSISIILGCGESTVKSHLKSVFAKLGVNSRVQAAKTWTELQQQK